MLNLNYVRELSIYVPYMYVLKLHKMRALLISTKMFLKFLHKMQLCIYLGLDIIYAQLHIQDASCLIKPIRDAWYVFKTQSVSINQCSKSAKK